jgi:hypothetical protein
MSDRARVLVLVLSCALAVGAAGCGGGSSSQTTPAAAKQTRPARPARRRGTTLYERQMQVLGERLAAELATAGRAVGAPTAKRPVIEGVLRTAQRQLRAAADELARIRPPAGIEQQHRRLIAAVREFANELTGVIAGVKKGNGAPVYAVIPNLKGLRDMQKASDAISKAGYRIVKPSA